MDWGFEPVYLAMPVMAQGLWVVTHDETHHKGTETQRFWK